MAQRTDPPSSVFDGTNSSYRSDLVRLTVRTKRFGNTLVYSSAFMAFVAAVEVGIATALLGLPVTPAPLVVGLVAFAVYTIDSVADADTDVRSNPDRANYARRYADQLMIAAAVAYGVAVALALVGGPAALALTLLPGAFWVLYASDWLPSLGRATGRFLGSVPRLKDVLLVNSVLVALGWAVAVTFLPLAFAGVAITPAVGVVFGYFFLRSFVDAELPNVRDVDADAAIGVATLPIVVGVEWTRRALYAVDLATATLVAAAVSMGLFAWPLAAALLVGVAISVGVTALAGRTSKPDLLGIAPDCSYIVVGVVIVGVWLLG
ncbi:UbiA family prenyltransferase [Halorubrum sp. DTA98]|uniref:UbiA family prenyltransferase n=1 Tax=Halorubrum sp. DTA98 TaxID=3402163 RepID=UPI003AB0A6DE